MVEWYVILPVVGSLLLLFSFGVGIACSQGFRQVLLGLSGDKGKFSLLNFFSVEGAGTILVVGLLIGGGVVYPLSRVPDIHDKEAQDEILRTARSELRTARKELVDLKERMDQLSNPKQWHLSGQLRMPEDWLQRWAARDKRVMEYFTNRERADEFWNQGNWTIFPQERVPIEVRVRAAKTNFKRAHVKIWVRVPKGMNLPDWISQITYENPLYDLKIELPFKDGKQSNYKFVGPHSINFLPLVLRPISSSIATGKSDGSAP